MAVVGEHIVVELIGVSTDVIDDIDLMKRTVEEITRLTDTDILNIAYHRFQPHGVTLVALLSTSHISFHTFPEINFISYDYFTCGTKSPAISVDVLRKNYNPEDIRVHSLKRGYIMWDIHEKEGYCGGYLVEDELAHIKTKSGQDIKVLNIKGLGTCLFCNDDLDLCVKDEKLYHEPFGAKAFQKLAKQKDIEVIVLGGGDGGIARECLRHDVSRIRILEMDEEVVDLSRKFFPSVSDGALDDPKVQFLFKDAFDTIRGIPDASQDIVFADLSDYAYRQIIANLEETRRILRPGGVFAAQIGPTDLAKTQIENYFGKMKELYASCEILDIYVPSYVNHWTLAFGIKV